MSLPSSESADDPAVNSVDHTNSKKEAFLIGTLKSPQMVSLAVASFQPLHWDICCSVQRSMVDVHDRRPVVLEPFNAMRWMDPKTPVEEAAHIVRWLKAFGIKI